MCVCMCARVCVWVCARVCVCTLLFVKRQYEGFNFISMTLKMFVMIVSAVNEKTEMNESHRSMSMTPA